MKCFVKFADILFLVVSERLIDIDEALKPFVAESSEKYDVLVTISWKWDEKEIPKKGFLGEDIINSYFEINGHKYCLTKGGHKGYLACTEYDKKMNLFKCYINEKPLLYQINNLSSILRMIPMKEILVHYGILFLHASQILYKNKGIIFAAPSGTGKTTQAKLWKKYRGAEILCNDRTMIRKKGHIWCAYGFPIDGSEPVRSNVVTEIAGIIILEQALVDNVQYLSVIKSVKYLMSQMVLDSWNLEEHNKIMDILLEFLEEKKVCLMQCTKDKKVVDVLENFLVESDLL